jgi:hypothetical protein
MRQFSRRDVDDDGGAFVPSGRPGVSAITDRLDAGVEVGLGGPAAPLAWLGGGAGDAVPAHLQERFGAAGADVSGVRLFTGASSASAAASVSARAFAVGQDVHFGAGQYQPGTADGDQLIAHELAHTVQQRGTGGTPQLALAISQPHDPAEVEADQFADAIISGSPRAALLPAQRPRAIARQSIPGPQASHDGFTDTQFAAAFPDGIHSFQRVLHGRPISSLFTPEEQRAVVTYMSDHRLPPVGTFATFFSTADESLRFVFSAALHVGDRSTAGTARGRNGQVVDQRAVRANDCGDWVGRVVTYARNEPYISRAQRRREHLASPDSLLRYGHGNQLRAEENADGSHSHRAVDQSIVDRLLPGDWVMLHWHPGTRPGADNHSLMFIEWTEDHWGRDGYRGARFADQGNNTVGGGNYHTYRICCDPTKNRYVYNVRSSRSFSAQARHAADDDHDDDDDAAAHAAHAAA